VHLRHFAVDVDVVGTDASVGRDVDAVDLEAIEDAQPEHLAWLTRQRQVRHQHAVLVRRHALTADADQCDGAAGEARPQQALEHRRAGVDLVERVFDLLGRGAAVAFALQVDPRAGHVLGGDGDDVVLEVVLGEARVEFLSGCIAFLRTT
jgi:hypothetical protein